MMTQIINILSILFILTFVGVSDLYGGIRENVKKILIDELGDSVVLSHQKISIPKDIKNTIQFQAKQKFFRDELNVWTILIADTVSHIAIIDNSLGKSMPITFLVVFTTNGRIRYTQIIKYREPYGGEISSLSWTSQFIGMWKDSEFKVGKTIDGISGATISTHSVTKGIHKLSLLFPYIENQLK
jgi:Na+-translocating ferredoxin:NAD+ oxidoreductase RnfG subunit